MELKHNATAGTLESSDAYVTIEPTQGGGVELSLTSSVLAQFGKQIKASVLDILERLAVTGVKVTVVDNGAIDCTLRARVASAVFRAADVNENLPWGVKL